MPPPFGIGVQIQLPPIVGHFILGPLGQAGGPANGGGPRIWAHAPGWAQAGLSSDSAPPRDNPGQFAPGGVFFVGVGGSKLPSFLLGGHPIFGFRPKR